MKPSTTSELRSDKSARTSIDIQSKVSMDGSIPCVAQQSLRFATIAPLNSMNAISKPPCAFWQTARSRMLADMQGARQELLVQALAGSSAAQGPAIPFMLREARLYGAAGRGCCASGIGAFHQTKIWCAGHAQRAILDRIITRAVRSPVGKFVESKPVDDTLYEIQWVPVLPSEASSAHDADGSVLMLNTSGELAHIVRSL